MKIVCAVLFTVLTEICSFNPASIKLRSAVPSKLNMERLVVISPPGGIGEVTAVNAAMKGSSVRWFVISPPSSDETISLSSQTLQSIQTLGGKIELAGAKADSLLIPVDDSSSSIGAISKWCQGSDGLVCTLDGVDQTIASMESKQGAKKLDTKEAERYRTNMVDAIKVAAKEAAMITSGMKIAVVAADDMDMDGIDEKDESSGFLGGILAKKVQVPKSLTTAMAHGSTKNLATLRYGELFGIPESSPDASPFVGGPRKEPVLREEYTMKGVRIESITSISNVSIKGENNISSRLSLGEAAVRMVSKSVAIMDGLDVCLTSLKGVNAPSEDEWSEEFSKVAEKISSGRGSELFQASFGSVPSIERLTDWIATKWAPAVLKTYEIAGIRVGARPVYAIKTAEGEVEIVWQELQDFKTRIVGKMIIEITKDSMTAKRQVEDASNSFNQLAGEDILVRRLSDAATQATEKGLATKSIPKSRASKLSDVESASTRAVVNTAPDTKEFVSPKSPTPITSDTGPRAGARRSSERVRGARKSDNSSETNSFE